MGCMCSSDTYLLKVHVIKATNLPTMDLRPTVDPYVKVIYDGKTMKTETIKNDNNPEFEETLVFENVEMGRKFIFEVWDWDRVSANDLIGNYQCPANGTYNQTEQLDFALLGKKEQGRLYVRIRFMKIPPGANAADYDDLTGFPEKKQDK
eukprot:395667_1